MINLRILISSRHSIVRGNIPSILSRGVSSTSSSSSSSDDENKKDLEKKKSQEAKEKLNLLLNSLIQDNANNTSPPPPKLELAKPIAKRKVKKLDEKLSDEKIDPAKQLINSVKEVAKVVKGDAKQTESELLQKLLNPVTDEAGATTSTNLSDIFKGIKIEASREREAHISRAQQVRKILQDPNLQPKVHLRRPAWKPILSRKAPENQVVDERVQLFGNAGLGAFPSATEVNSWPEQNLNKTWNALEERELRLAVIHPPSNYFQQMIQWTEQGKIWRFPIDNEQGMEVEKTIPFTEHIFLEKHIDSWCPQKGPIRHFMELVLVGLSKNPYITVENKKEHIEWFRNYFDEKKTLLQEVEAIPAGFEFIKDSKKLEA